MMPSGNKKKYYLIKSGELKEKKFLFNDIKVKYLSFN